MFDYVVVNENGRIDDTAEALESIMRAERWRYPPPLYCALGPSSFLRRQEPPANPPPPTSMRRGGSRTARPAAAGAGPPARRPLPCPYEDRHRPAVVQGHPVRRASRRRHGRGRPRRVPRCRHRALPRGRRRRRHPRRPRGGHRRRVPRRGHHRAPRRAGHRPLGRPRRWGHRRRRDCTGVRPRPASPQRARPAPCDHLRRRLRNPRRPRRRIPSHHPRHRRQRHQRRRRGTRGVAGRPPPARGRRAHHTGRRRLAGPRRHRRLWAGRAAPGRGADRRYGRDQRPVRPRRCGGHLRPAEGRVTRRRRGRWTVRWGAWRTSRDGTLAWTCPALRAAARRAAWARGLAAFLGARIAWGADIVAEAVGLDARLDGASLVVTGEGRLDWQTAYHKAPAVVANRASARGIPVLGVGGSLGPGWRKLYAEGFTALTGMATGAVTVEDAMAHPGEHLMRATLRGAAGDAGAGTPPFAVRHNPRLCWLLLPKIRCDSLYLLEG